MSTRQRILDDMKQALKAGQKDRLNTLRMLRARIQEAELARRAKEGPEYQLSEEETVRAISGYAKQRRDSIASYRDAGRKSLAAQEQAELAIVQDYLPQQLSEDELREIVKAAVAETGASSPRQMGLVMKAVMPKLGGRADGKLVNRIVRELLS